MALKVGLVGLPNVGKSTLFNALSKSEQAQAENFPFCTIEPNVAVVPVPDQRLEWLAETFNSEKTIPSTVKFVDIAGLVKGASTGEGLGNKFLAHIAEVDLIVHVLRCFEDTDIVHVDGKINPVSDFETIVSELAIRDLDSIDKREQKLTVQIKKARDPKEKTVLEKESEFLTKIKVALENENYREAQEAFEQARKDEVPMIPLLAVKKFLIAANLSEDDLSGNNFENNELYKNLQDRFGAEKVVPLSAKIEADLSLMDDSDQKEMRESLDLSHSGLNALIKRVYQDLGLITFFTCGPKEAHAWEVPAGYTAPQAAGTIHSDLERGFICAETYNYSDIKSLGSESAIKDAGRQRKEGKDYKVQDGDIILVRFNV